MATVAGEIVYKITGDSSGLKTDIQRSESGLKTFGKTVAAAFSVAAAVAFGRAIVSASSAAAETAQKFGVVYSKISEAANKAAKDLAEGYAMSDTAAKDLLGSTGNILQSLGYTQDAALKTSVQLAQLGADVTSFSNFQGGAVEATKILTKAMLGERDALQSLDIKISEEDLKSYAEAQGLVLDKLDQRAKAELTVALLMERTELAQGDMARSASSYENTMRGVNARMETLSVLLGDELTPALAELGRAFLLATRDGGPLITLFKDIISGLGSIVKLAATAMNLITADQAAKQSTRNSKEIANNFRQVRQSYEVLNKYLAGNKLDLTKKDDRAKLDQLIEGYKNGNVEITASAASIKAQAAAGFTIDDVIKTQLTAIDDYKKKATGLIDANSKLVNTMRDANDAIYGSKDLGKGAATSASALLRENRTPAGGTGGKPVAEAAAKAAQEAARANSQYILLASTLGLAGTEAEKLYAALTPEEKTIAQVNLLAGAFGKVGEALNLVANLAAAFSEIELRGIEDARQAALEKAGVDEETALKKAQREYDLLTAAQKADENNETVKALKREQINEKFDKKKAQAEYKAAMTAWALQLASATAMAAQAVLSTFASTAAIPLVGPELAPAAAAAAGVFGALQIAAVAAAMPPKPKFANGGIVPGSSLYGDNVAIQANSEELVLTKQQQGRLFAMANGTGGGMMQFPPMSEDALYREMFKASQDGRLFMSSRSVVNK